MAAISIISPARSTTTSFVFPTSSVPWSTSQTRRVRCLSRASSGSTRRSTLICPYVAAPGSGEKLSKRKLDTYFKRREFKQIYDHGAAVMRRLGVSVSPDTFNPWWWISTEMWVISPRH